MTELAAKLRVIGGDKFLIRRIFQRLKVIPRRIAAIDQGRAHRLCFLFSDAEGHHRQLCLRDARGLQLFEEGNIAVSIQSTENNSPGGQF